MKTRILGILLAVAMAIPAISMAAGHRPIIYSGELMAENGLPYTGSVNVSVTAWDAPEMGNEIWTQGMTTYDVVNGVLDIELGVGDQAPLMAVLAGNTEIWLTFMVDGEMLSPRQELTAHPYAAVAGNAQRLGGMMPADFQLAGDSIEADALPTAGIGQVSNGALNNQFGNVSLSWMGDPADILDAEPIDPPPPAMATINTGESAGSYLTSIEIDTSFALNFENQISMVLAPPAESGVAPFVLLEGNFLQGTYDNTWTVGDAPELQALIGQQLVGTWTLTITDLNNNAAGQAQMGVLSEFDIRYDVVRADHLTMAGRLDVSGDLNVGGNAEVQGHVRVAGRVVSDRFIFVNDGDDGCNNGACGNRVFTYPKLHDDTALLIDWQDNFRCEGSGTRICIWHIRIDGQDCSDPPLAMRYALHANGGDYSNIHRSGSGRYICRAINGAPIAAGDHTIQVYETYNDGSPGNPYLGWNDTAVIEVQEVTY